jgi:hypothetical protein
MIVKGLLGWSVVIVSRVVGLGLIVKEQETTTLSHI